MWTKRRYERIQHIVKHTQKIHIWAAFSSMGTFPLYIFRSNTRCQVVYKDLRSHLLAQAPVFHGKERFLVQGNDPKHTANATKRWMLEKMPQNKLDWPSQSSDINPFENLFAWLKQSIIKRGPKNITQP